MAGPGVRVDLFPDSEPSCFGYRFPLCCMLLSKSLVEIVGLLREKNRVKRNQFQVTECLRVLEG